MYENDGNDKRKPIPIPLTSLLPLHCITQLNNKRQVQTNQQS